MDIISLNTCKTDHLPVPNSPLATLTPPKRCLGGVKLWTMIYSVLRIVQSWFFVCCVPLLLEDLLNTHNIFIGCFKNFLIASELCALQQKRNHVIISQVWRVNLTYGNSTNFEKSLAVDVWTHRFRLRGRMMFSFDSIDSYDAKEAFKHTQCVMILRKKFS